MKWKEKKAPNCADWLWQQHRHHHHHHHYRRHLNRIATSERQVRERMRCHQEPSQWFLLFFLLFPQKHFYNFTDIEQISSQFSAANSLLSDIEKKTTTATPHSGLNHKQKINMKTGNSKWNIHVWFPSTSNTHRKITTTKQILHINDATAHITTSTVECRSWEYFVCKISPQKKITCLDGSKNYSSE